jgi:hypothetical protein
MSEYFPDRWIVIDIDNGSSFKVFGTWAGSYLSSDSWRLNSFVVRVEETEDHFIFVGNSGSRYYCAKERYGVAGAYNYGILDQLLYPVSDVPVKVMPEDTDWLNLITPS